MSDSLERSLKKALSRKFWRDIARAGQIPPDDGWDIWLLRGGRGSGKTRSAAEWITEMADRHPGCRIALVGRAADDIRSNMVDGESGVISVQRPWNRVTYEPTKMKVSWENGASALTRSAEEPNSLRGPEFHYAWVDEFGAFSNAKEVWDNLTLGLRLAPARCVVSTTPNARNIESLKILQWMVDLAMDPMAGLRVVQTVMTTYDNLPNLAPNQQEKIRTYRGTRVGRQELEAEILLDAPGALWNRAVLEATRVKPEDVPRSLKLVLAIDPSTGDEETTGECGIVVVGVDERVPNHGYVLADLSMRAHPNDWSRVAVESAKAYHVSAIVAEKNQGGEMVRTVLQTRVPGLPIHLVNASRSKEARAEPVGAIWEQHRGHMVGVFEELEAQLCSWYPGSGKSPDRLDALVWGISFLMVPEEDAPAQKYAAASLRSALPGQKPSVAVSGFVNRRPGIVI